MTRELDLMDDLLQELSEGISRKDPNAIPMWEKMDTTPKVTGKDVESVYKLPTSEHMLSQFLEWSANLHSFRAWSESHAREPPRKQDV